MKNFLFYFLLGLIIGIFYPYLLIFDFQNIIYHHFSNDESFKDQIANNNIYIRLIYGWFFSLLIWIIIKFKK